MDCGIEHATSPIVPIKWHHILVQVDLYVEDDAARARLTGLTTSSNGVDELRYLFVTSAVSVVDDEPSGKFCESDNLPGLGRVTALVRKADGSRCERCWNYSMQLGRLSGHAHICDRCAPVVEQMGFELPEAEAPREPAAAA